MEQENDLSEITKLPSGMGIALMGVALLSFLFFKGHYVSNICADFFSQEFARSVMSTLFVTSIAMIVLGLFGQVVVDISKVLFNRITREDSERF